MVAVPDPVSDTAIFWQIAVGGVISRTVTTHEQVAVLPVKSVARKVKLVAPIGKVKPETGPLVWVTAGILQLSVATGVEKVYMYPQVPASLLTVVLAGQEVNAGGTGSDTVIRAVHVLVLPLSSCAVKVTVTGPGGVSVLPAAGLWIFTMLEELVQLSVTIS